MLAYKICDFSEDVDQYCKETLYFVIFQGGGGPGPLPPSGTADDTSTLHEYCSVTIITVVHGILQPKHLRDYWYKESVLVNGVKHLFQGGHNCGHVNF